MPTYNRRHDAARAVEYFLRQDYAARELIVVDDGTDPVGDVVPSDERIRYVRSPRRLSIGAKRNLACELARGTVIVHWDDDDWQSPHRLRAQVDALTTSGKPLCGINAPYYLDRLSGETWQYRYPPEQRPWIAGNTLAYRRDFWSANRFADLTVGEDTDFIWRVGGEQIHVMPDNGIMVAIKHPGNASPKPTHTYYWHPVPPALVAALLGEDWKRHTGTPPPAAYRAHLRRPPRARGAMIAARARDLALPELAAYDPAGALPPMRRWELPYALAALRLDNTSAVLDCTINPAGFGERLAQLYPHVLYRHAPAIQSGAFAPPIGFPDGAFDRVLCVNTLEHLPAAQRETLLAEIARKLKPGGALVLTADYYFDSAWHNPHTLALGVMRSDRAEIFNGWNKTRPGELVAACAAHGLRPLEPGSPEEPREDDAALYVNDPPYPHATVAGVFTKGTFRPPRPRRIVLALLTWNTCAASVESLCALVREAYALERLGHEPHVFVVDNGSDDGTAEALRALEPEIGVPHRVECNAENVGNSRARNRIVDYALGVDADYVLFVDGDIELVPHSAVAMLRYLEGCGRALACIGADSNDYSEERARTTPSLFSLHGLRIETLDLVAWTQYGLFRAEIFRDGVRFDEDPPFDGAGWGFEDNDLAFQMEVKGYRSQRFMGVTYLHRKARSSIRIMRRLGIDADALFAKRRSRLLEKWAHVAPIAQGPLLAVQRSTALPHV